jgi:polyisoprenoid-binding protein YceI
MQVVSTAGPKGITLLRRGAALAGLAGGLAALVASGGLAAENPAWRIEGEVRVTCPMTVGGSFEAKTTALGGTVALTAARPPAFGGELSVDLKTLDTGIDLRNHHLRDNYLEVAKGEGFETATLTEIRLGDVDAETFQGRTEFTGTFLLHGTKKPVAGQAEIARTGQSVRVEATFPVTIADYGIAKPQYLGVGVKSQVQVKVSLVATPVGAAGVSR